MDVDLNEEVGEQGYVYGNDARHTEQKKQDSVWNEDENEERNQMKEKARTLIKDIEDEHCQAAQREAKDCSKSPKAASFAVGDIAYRLLDGQLFQCTVLELRAGPGGRVEISLELEDGWVEEAVPTDEVVKLSVSCREWEGCWPASAASVSPPLFTSCPSQGSHASAVATAESPHVAMTPSSENVAFPQTYCHQQPQTRHGHTSQVPNSVWFATMPRPTALGAKPPMEVIGTSSILPSPPFCQGRSVAAGDRRTSEARKIANPNEPPCSSQASHNVRARDAAAALAAVAAPFLRRT